MIRNYIMADSMYRGLSASIMGIKELDSIVLCISQAEEKLLGKFCPCFS